VLGLLVVMALAGCGHATSHRIASASSTPSATAVWNPRGDAKANRAFFDQTLRPLSGDQLPTSRAVVDALASRGVPKTSMQVTPDRTPKNLAADMITISVQLGSECLLGQFNPGAYTSRAAATVNGACLVGDTLPITW
jgi:hypothetical protein